MRTLAWIAVGLLAVVIAGVIVIALSLNRLIEKNRERLLAQAQTALGRQVSADRILVNVWGGLGARVENLRVADDPQFGDEDFVQAKAAVVAVEFWPLLHRQLNVRRVDLKEPRIQLIRARSGHWNYETIGVRKSTPAAENAPAPTPSPRPAPRLPFELAVADIENGSVVVTDLTQTPTRTITVNQVSLTLGDVSETTPVSFDFQAAVQQDARNVKVHGVVGPLGDGSTVPLQLDGSLGPLGPQKLHIDAIHVEGTLTPTALQLAHLDGRAFDGAFQLNGQVPLRNDAAMRLQGELTNMSIPQTLALVSPDASNRVAGHGHVRLDLHGTGGSPAALRSTLAGEIAADLHDATLKDFNIVREVLGRGSRLPVIGDLLASGVKPRYEQLAAAPDTRFQVLRATFHIADQTLRTNDLTIEASDFTVRAAGSVTFAQEADITGVLAMSPAFSRQVASDVKEAKYLLDDQQRLELPFRLRGRLGVAKPEPDTSALVNRLGQNLTRGGAKDLLKGLLGGAAPAGPTPKTESGKSGIEQGLRRLFGR